MTDMDRKQEPTIVTLTENQSDLLSTISELYSAKKWRELVALEERIGEASVQLRKARPDLTAGIYWQLAESYQIMGQFDRAVGPQEQAREIYEEIGDRSRQRSICNNLGLCYQNLGLYDKAIEVLQQALAIAKAAGNRTDGTSKTCTNLGGCFQALGQYEKAIKLHQEARTIAMEVFSRTDEGVACGNLGGCFQELGDHDKAIELFHQDRACQQDVGDRAGEGAACQNIGVCLASLGKYEEAIHMLEQAQTISKEVDNQTDLGKTCTNLGVCHEQLGYFDKAITLYTQGLQIAEQERDRLGQASACNNLGECHNLLGDHDKAIRVLEQGRAILEMVEQDVGSHDDWRVSLFERQQDTYKTLQSALLSKGQKGWALGLAAQAKARALSYHLDENQHNLGTDDGTNANSSMDANSSIYTASTSYEGVYEAWWVEMQRMARAEGSATCIVEFSFLPKDTMAMWVLSGTGDLLCSTTVVLAGLGETKNRTIEQLLAEARTSMNVRGRDALVCSAITRNDLTGSDTDQTSASSHAEADVASGTALLQEIYRVLLQPIEAFLVGFKELLIVPHQELFKVPWAALIDADGQYLIERYVIRVAPSLRVARQAAAHTNRGQTSGQVVVVGNPWPNRVSALKGTEEEAKKVLLKLTEEDLTVRFLAKNKATKARVKEALQGAPWAHFACHGDIDSDSLVLAIPSGTHDADKATSDLSMEEVQEGVKLGHGATVVLSACNTGRGDIKAEGVVGLARGFLMANASAAVVSLWSVSCADFCSTMFCFVLLATATIPLRMTHTYVHNGIQLLFRFMQRMEFSFYLDLSHVAFAKNLSIGVGVDIRQVFRLTTEARQH